MVKTDAPLDDRLLVQIASYNTNLQGVLGLPQDLVDWLAPTLQVSSFLSRERRAPDIVAVGFQELLPLPQGRAFTHPAADTLCQGNTGTNVLGLS
jgi:hypothetical protein